MKKFINESAIYGYETNSLNFVVKSSFRTFHIGHKIRARILMPDLSIKVPYKIHNEKYYLYSGICSVSALYKDEEYFIRIPQMYQRGTTFGGSEHYSKFCNKFNYKEDWGHCYSSELHGYAAGFKNEKDMKDWFCQKFFHSYWCFRNLDQWQKYQKIDQNFMKYITCNFSKTFKRL
jgi:hypothetical protein